MSTYNQYIKTGINIALDLQYSTYSLSCVPNLSGPMQDFITWLYSSNMTLFRLGGHANMLTLIYLATSDSRR